MRRQLKKKAESTYYTKTKDSYTIKGNRFTRNPVIELQLLASQVIGIAKE
jgi:hypothetical protein